MVVGNARYDANAKLTGVLIAPEFDSQLGLGDHGPIAIGPDGRAYSYAALKKVVRFVELAFTTP